MFNKNDRLIELLQKNYSSQMDREEYIELVELMNEVQDRIYSILNDL
jgi:hypothetical protein